MKKMYRVGEDFFIALAFVSFFVGIVTKFMNIAGMKLALEPEFILGFAVISLLFSIALSLYELAQQR